MDTPWKEFDLSALTYPQFLAFFLDRPVVGDKNEDDLFRSGIDRFVASDPTTVVGYLETTCRSLAELVKVYSPEQLDQGLWAVFGAGISCEQYLFVPAVDCRLRIDCVESMYLPFRDVVVHHSGDIRGSFYWMWWDLILHTFWLSTDQYKVDRSDLDAKQLIEHLRQVMSRVEDYSALTHDQELIAGAMYQTLSKILALNSRGCQWCALHGLGHLHHPLAGELVQRYLDEHRSELNDEDVQWIEARTSPPPSQDGLVPSENPASRAVANSTS